MKNKNYVLPFSCDRITMKRLAIGFAVAIALLCASLVFGQAPTIDIFKSEGLQRNASPQGRKANNAELKKARLQKKVKFRLAQGLEADMTETEIFTPDFYVYTNKGKRKAIKKGKHYFDDHKFGAVSITDDNQVSGTMNRMAIGQDGFQIDTIIPQPFETGESPILPVNQTGLIMELPSATPEPFVVSCKQVRFFLEVTYPYYLASGGTIQGTVDNISGWFAQVASIYLREGIVIKIQSIKVNQTQDSYSKITSSSAMLLSFAETEGVKPEAKNYDLGALIDLNTPSRAFGGIAYVNGINYAPAKYSSMGVDVTYRPAAFYSWTVGCAAHEWGHNLGSKHTQWCGWDLGGGVKGAIDGCAQSEKNNGIQCTNIPRACIVGTIMSYCHICWPGSIDLNLGFGPLPGAAIRAGLAASNVPCVGTPPSPCSLWTYSPWSSCTNGTQTRTAIGTPTGCLGSPPLPLAQSCTTVCTTWSYSAWSDCVNGVQTRTATASPNGCTGTAPGPLSQSCAGTVAQDGVPGAVLMSTRSDGKSWFDFPVAKDAADWLYEVQYCSYEGKNPPDSISKPKACAIRNLTFFVRPTAAEVAAGKIERIANPQPYTKGLYYKVQVRYKKVGNGTIYTKNSGWSVW